MIKALLLIAHGSRNKEANEDLIHLAKRLVSSELQIVEPSYLELAEPEIETAGDTCVAKGAQLVIMVPYFLSAGIHVRKDLIESLELKSIPKCSLDLQDTSGHIPCLKQLSVKESKRLFVKNSGQFHRLPAHP
jgi:hypothetical protein